MYEVVLLARGSPPPARRDDARWCGAAGWGAAGVDRRSATAQSAVATSTARLSSVAVPPCAGYVTVAVNPPAPRTSYLL